jgi:hypothetical protein
MSRRNAAIVLDDFACKHARILSEPPDERLATQRRALSALHGPWGSAKARCQNSRTAESPRRELPHRRE